MGARGIRGKRLWSGAFLLAGLAGLLLSMTANMMNGILARYVEELGLGVALTGWLGGSFAACSIGARLLAGRGRGTRGQRLGAALGCAVLALALGGMAFARGRAALLLLRGAQGFGYALATTVVYALGAQLLPRGRLGEGMGYLGLGLGAATAIGPGLALTAAGRFGYGGAFFLCGGMALGALACVPGIQKTAGRGTEEPSAVPSGGWLERRAVPAAVCQTLASGALAAVYAYGVVYGGRLGAARPGLYFTAAAGALVAARLVTGRWADQWGTAVAAAPALLAQGAGLALLALSPGGWSYYASGALVGVGMGAANPALQAAAAKKAPPGRAGAASGTYQLAGDLAAGLGGILWGQVIARWGFPAAFWGAAVLSALAAGATLFCGKRGLI